MDDSRLVMNEWEIFFFDPRWCIKEPLRTFIFISGDHNQKITIIIKNLSLVSDTDVHDYKT